MSNAFNNRIAEKILSDIDGWQLRPSDKTYREVKTALNRLAQTITNDLQGHYDRYLTGIEIERSVLSKKLERIRQEKLDAPNLKAETDCEGYIAALNERYEAAKATLTAISRSLRAVKAADKDSGKAAAVVSGVKSLLSLPRAEDLDKRKEQAEKKLKSLDSARKDAIASAKKLQKIIKAQNRFYYDSAVAAAKEEYNIAVNKRVAGYKRAVMPQLEYYEKLLFSHLGKETFDTAFDNALAKNAELYRASCSVPEFIYFGKRTFTIKADGMSGEIAELFDGIGNPMIKLVSNEIRVTLPYCRTLKEGLSVYFEAEDTASDRNNEIVRDYVLKMLMSFPAGQTVPVLLDCDSTDSLTDFKDIGEASGKNTVTRPWTEPEEIASSLKMLAQERSKLTIAYGKDRRSRMAKESIYVLADRNFPKAIDRTAADLLSGILLAGSKNGFFGIIQANAAAVAAKQTDADMSAAVSSIKKSCFCVFERAGGFVTEEKDGADSFEFERLRPSRARLAEIIGRLIEGTKNYSKQAEKFEDLFSKDAANTEGITVENTDSWHRGDASKRFEIPIGISGAGTVQKYVIDGISHHCLISGVTGSGKSTLLKAIILSSMIKYSPEQLSLYLVDFKNGVEFNTFGSHRLPWIKALALNTQRVFAKNILCHLQGEFESRTKLLKQYGVSHIGDIKDKKFPRILFIIDEVQELLRVDDDITKECVSILSSLVSEARAVNINIIIASQNFAECAGIDSLKTNMVTRIALKGSMESAAVIMGDGFASGQLENGESGYCAINTASGAAGHTTFFRAGFIEPESARELIRTLEQKAKAFPSDTRIMSVYAEEDKTNTFNRFIASGERPAHNTKGCELFVGDDFSIAAKKHIFLKRGVGENIAAIGENAEIARSLFTFTILSALYGGVKEVRLIDASDEDEPFYDHFERLQNIFAGRLCRNTIEDCADAVDSTFKLMLERQQSGNKECEPVYLMIYGIDGIMELKSEMESDDISDLSSNQKLIRIIREGAQNNINCIMWATSLDGFKDAVDSPVLKNYFSKRFYFDKDSDITKQFLGKSIDMSLFEKGSVIYRDIKKPSPFSFRAYACPESKWLEDFAAALEKADT